MRPIENLHLPKTFCAICKRGNGSVSTLCFSAVCAFAFGLPLLFLSGCATTRSTPTFGSVSTPCQKVLQEIEQPVSAADVCQQGDDDLLGGPPITISTFGDIQSLDMTLDECVEKALANSKVMQKLGGVVVSAPAGTTTLYDQAIVETGTSSVENALSAFDAQFNSSFFYNQSQRRFNNLFIGGGAPSLTTHASSFQTELSKQTATGATVAARNFIDYNRNDSPANVFSSTYDALSQLEFRQPLLRGRGTAINRIAGPNAQPGQYNGVLIRRIRSDISLADFQAAVRDLVRDVENSYWELHFAYRDLDTKLAARESARKTWENRKLRFDNGLGRPDDEAQARQQYFSFNAQAKNALAGTPNGQLGVLGAERNLRRLLGINNTHQQLIRPVTEPVMAPVAFDWQTSQQQTLENRIELNRQKWTIRQRELELLAAKQLNKWRFDFVGQYGFRGFGDNLLGSRDRTDGSALATLANGDLHDWQLGVELGGAIGNRAGHLAIRNAELNLVRERAILKEQQRQVLHDLEAAYTEVDRSLNNMKTTYNSRLAAFDELEPKRKRVEEGQDQVFFLLDAQQRTATAESAVHRAVADYNRALASYAYACGGMLARFNIQLTEGPWNESAQQKSAERVGRRHKQPKKQFCKDLPDVSRGPAVQSAVAPVAYEGQWVGEETIIQ